MNCPCGCGPFRRRNKAQRYASKQCGTRVRVRRWYEKNERAQHPERLCACGCGRRFLARSTRNRFATPECRGGGRNVTESCACGCGVALLRRGKGLVQRYASAKCETSHQRRKQRASKPARHPNTVLIWQLRDEMDAEGKAGLCIYCERRLQPRRTLICGLPDDIGRGCVQSHNSDWKRGRTMNERLAKEQAA